MKSILVSLLSFLTVQQVKPGEGPVPYPSIHAPWYGYLLWTVAATGGIGRAADATFVPATIDNKGKCGANMKVMLEPGVLYICQLADLASVDSYQPLIARFSFPTRPCTATLTCPSWSCVFSWHSRFRHMK